MEKFYKYFNVERISNEKNLIFNYKKKLNDLTYHPAIFFDRDGVLIEDRHHISNPNDVKLLPGVKKLLLTSNENGMANIVVTNQSGIFRGFFNWEEYEKVTFQMLNIIGYPYNINAIYACGSSPKKTINSWRKPNPDMFFSAKDRFKISLDQSIMIGDRLSDLQAGLNAGVKMVVHVLTGKGKEERKKVIKFFNFSDNNDCYKFPFMAKINKRDQKVLLINNLLDFKLDFSKIK